LEALLIRYSIIGELYLLKLIIDAPSILFLSINFKAIIYEFQQTSLELGKGSMCLKIHITKKETDGNKRKKMNGKRAREKSSRAQDNRK